MLLGIRLIVGLGNPGTEYANTRHNVGAWFVDFVVQQHQLTFKKESKFHGFLASFSVDSEVIWLLKPSTFMNESGLCVGAVSRFYKIPVESILVVHDDLDFEVGVVRLKKGGGHGGHNGLRDVIQHLALSDFYRLRIGIHHPGDRDRVVSHVLTAPSVSDRKKIMAAIQEAAAVLPQLIAGEFQKAFYQLHSEI